MENAGPEAMEIKLPERWAVLEEALREISREARSSGDVNFAKVCPPVEQTTRK